MTRILGIALILLSARCSLNQLIGQQPEPASIGFPTDKLIELALTRNEALLAGRARVQQAEGLLRQAGLRPNPTFQLSVTNGAVLGSSGESEYSLGFAHTIETAGKRGRRVAAGEVELEIAKFTSADLERRLRFEVRSAAAEAMAAMRNLETTEQLIELNEQSLRIVAARTGQGEAPRLERTLVEVEGKRLQADRLLFGSQVDRALQQLKLLAGMRPDETLRLDGSALIVPPLSVKPDELLGQALARRPDLASARREIGLREAELELAKAGSRPDITASGSYSRISSRFDQFGLAGAGGPLVLLRDSDNVLTAGVSFGLPIRNRNQGNIEAAAVRIREAGHRARFTEQSVRQEVDAATHRYLAAREVLALFDEGIIKQSEENLRVLRAAYDLGELRLLDVLNEQRRMADTQKAYTEALRQSYLALAELEQAAGGALF